MEHDQQRALKVFQNVLALPKQWPTEMSDPEVVARLDQLRAIDTSIADLVLRRGPTKGPTHRTGQVAAWIEVVRKDYLMKLKREAALHLRDNEGKPIKRQVPPTKAKPTDVVNAVDEFDRVLRPRMPELVAKGINPTILDRMLEGRQKIYHWRMEVPEERGVKKKLSDEIKARISEGLQVVDVIRSSVWRAMESNPVFRAAFRSAARAPAKAGPPKSPRRTAIQQAKHERRRKKPRRNRPE